AGLRAEDDQRSGGKRLRLGETDRCRAVRDGGSPDARRERESVWGRGRRRAGPTRSTSRDHGPHPDDASDVLELLEVRGPSLAPREPELGPCGVGPEVVRGEPPLGEIALRQRLARG